MRLKYYIRSIKKIRFKKAFTLALLIILFLFFILIYMYKAAVPMIITLCESSAKSIALEVTNKAVYENIQNTKYENLINLKQDNSGKIIAMNANVMELNRLSTSISSNVSERLQNITTKHVKIPLTSIFNLNLFSGYGPKIPLNIIPTGSVTSKFSSEFEQAGINQIRHRIFLNITTRVRLIAPFYISSQEYTNEITVAETIIVGDVPNSYYNITGIDNLGKKDTLNLIEK